MGVDVKVGRGVSVAGMLVKVAVASLVGVLFNCLLPPQLQQNTIPMIDTMMSDFFTMASSHTVLIKDFYNSISGQ
jgi:hypothetical protein